MTASRVLCTTSLVPHRGAITAAEALATVDAAAAAGFDGIALWSMHHDWAVADGLAPEAFLEHVGGRGLTVPVVEVLLDWVGLPRAAIADAARPVLDVAEAAGASRVIAATLADELPPVERVARDLGHVCDLAADRALAVSIEFLPWRAVADLATALRLLDACGRENLGLVVDTWHLHHQRGGLQLDLLRQVPPERIHVLQLGDAGEGSTALPRAELRQAAATGRLLPGEGVVDLDAIVDALVDIAADPVVAPEVLSAAVAGLGAPEAARRIFAATDAVLAGRLAWGRRPVAR